MIIPSKVYVIPVYIKQFYLYSIGKRMPDTETTPEQLQLPTHALLVSASCMYKYSRFSWQKYIHCKGAPIIFCHSYKPLLGMV